MSLDVLARLRYLFRPLFLAQHTFHDVPTIPRPFDFRVLFITWRTYDTSTTWRVGHVGVEERFAINFFSRAARDDDVRC